MSEHYIGKDLVHYGNGLSLDPELAHESIAYSARKNIRKAERKGFEIQRRSGTPEELCQLRALWYFPDDPNFPDHLQEDQMLYMAYLNNVLVGGMILIPVGRHLFLNNLTASSEAKKYHLQGYMLWHAVNDLKDSAYRYIDIGASYRVNLHRFFSKWATFHYPVIFNPPELKPDIRFQPFKGLPQIQETAQTDTAMRKLCGGRPYTVVPSMQYARAVAKAYDLTWNPVCIPGPGREVQMINLTELFPLQYGALIIGMELDAETLWSRFGCYDHFKIRYIHACLSLAEWDIASIAAKREENYQCYLKYFGEEDLSIAACDQWVDGFRFACDDADGLAGRLSDFGVQTRRNGRQLTLPCHQTISFQDIEYVYAVFRGYLNLCSEWESTAIRGSIKLTGS